MRCSGRFQQRVILRMSIGATDEEIDDKSYVKLVDINFAQIVVSHALDDVLGGGATVRLVFFLC